MNIEVLSAFVLASVALTISPGPDIIYVLMQGMVNGKKYGIATAAGLVTGIIVHTTLVAFGVSAIIKQSDSLFLVIKICGALYLLYLAYKVFKSKEEITLSNSTIKKKSLQALFKQGFIMNVLNPKVTIFFLAFFPGFIFSNSMPHVWQFYILGFIFMLQAFIIFCLVAILSGSISKYLLQHKHMQTILKWLQILVFIGIGIFILL